MHAKAQETESEAKIQFAFLECQEGYENKYRNRAISGRSRLVATPLRNHAITHFLCIFYVTIRAHKEEVLNSWRALYWRGYGI